MLLNKVWKKRLLFKMSCVIILRHYARRGCAGQVLSLKGGCSGMDTAEDTT